MAKYDIVTRAERRRKFTDEQKAEIVNEALGRDGVIAEVARKHELSQSLLHRWIREHRDQAGFAVLKVAEETPAMSMPRCSPVPLRVTLRAGHSLELPAGSPMDFVMELLRSLGGLN